MELSLKAPLSGILVPIERVPDPVFSGKMVGDGISIDPTSQVLVAPCDGEVVQLHAAGHALTLSTQGGVEVMLHIGLETVGMKGKGFRPKTKKGAKVRAGDPLIEFDADLIALEAESLLTQMVIVNGDRVAQFKPQQGHVIAGKDVVLGLVLKNGAAGVGQGAGGKAAPSAEAWAESDPIAVANPEGLHARPVAVLAGAAKRFQSEVAVKRGDRQANAKSIVAVMGLEVAHGDEIRIVAKGADAVEAVKELAQLLKDGLGEAGARPAATSARVRAAAKAAAPLSVSAAPADPKLIQGVGASGGLAVGNVFQIRREEIVVEEKATDSRAESRKFGQALEAARLELAALQTRLQGQADADKAAIFAAHQEIVADPELLEMVDEGIRGGKTAAFAWKRAIQEHAGMLAGLKNELLAARANDVRDVGSRVLRLLAGETAAPSIEPPRDAILIAEDLTPSDTASLDRSRVLGFCTVAGGATSHVAILARSLGIPAIAGIEPRALEVANGTQVVLDGTAGTLRLSPSKDEIRRIQTRQERHEIRRKEDLAHAQEPAVTRDGHRVEVAANIGGAAEAEQAMSLGGEGVGLLRSEFIFLERTTAPDEEEQGWVYEKIARTLGPDRPLVIRTLDVGGDKPLPYLPMPREENPFLGVRGIRIGLEKPEILRPQLRAILTAAPHGKVLVMFPMITTLEEFKLARHALEEEAKALGVKMPGVGIMVEVPAAAVLADRFAPHVDFFSIGTNDLTQYTLAMDRGHPRLAPQIDGLDPAVLRLIDMTVRAAHAQKKWVGVCGGIASEQAAVPILIGLGVDELSVSVPVIPAIKAQVRGLSRADCQKVAQAALGAATAAEVRGLVAPLLDKE